MNLWPQINRRSMTSSDSEASIEGNGMNVSTALDLLRSVEFLDYVFEVRTSHGGFFLQAKYEEPDTYSNEPAVQFTRKWLLSPHMTDSEVVSTAFKCCLTSMEHRTREAFKYKGARIFGPHFGIEDLVAICHDGKENAGGRKSAEEVRK